MNPKTKTKKLRRRVKKAPTKSKMEMLYDSVQAAGTTLPVSVKENEKFVVLLDLHLRGRVDARTLVHIIKLPEERLFYGPVEAVFKTTTPLRHMTRVRLGVFPDQVVSACELVGVNMKHLPHVNLIQDGGKIFRYPPGTVVYLEVEKQEELPADLRKWKSRVSKSYISLSVENPSGENRRTRDRQSSSKITGSGVNGLHQIRRININPGKKQLEERTKYVKPSRKSRNSYGMADMNTVVPIATGSYGYASKAARGTANALKKNKEKLFDF